MEKKTTRRFALLREEEQRVLELNGMARDAEGGEG